MKKLLALVITAVFASTSAMAVAADKPAEKKSAEKKSAEKKVKKHKKAEGTKIPEAPKKK